MSYEPRGKVATLMDAMRREPARIWTSPEVAEVMDVNQKALTAHLDTAIRHGTLYRKLEGGRCQYALKPFVTAPAAPAPRPTTSNGWQPPQMVPPRGTSAPVAQERGETAGGAGGAGAAPAVPPLIATRPPEPAPVLADASISEGAGPAVDDPEDEVQSDAYVSCRTGEIVIVGIAPDEDGRITVPADLVALIKRQIAWGPMA